MKYTISEEVTKKEWEAFLLSQPHPQFLQSWNMRELHTGIKQESFVVAIRKKDGEIIGGTFAAIVRARRGSYLYMPYGPVIDDKYEDALQPLTDYLQKRGKELKMDFLRSSPFIAPTPEHLALYADAGWKKAPIHMLAEHVWWLDCTQSEEDILKGMRKTMRNLIRRASKDGVTIRFSTDIEDAKLFDDIHQSTVLRHNFTPYTRSYFLSQVEAFTPDNEVGLFIAEYQGKAIAAAIMMFYGSLASYHHGASLSEFKKIPASYLLQWHAILEAKKRGCTQYNFWGIVPPEHELSPVLKRKHPFSGVTTFKTGFGGEQFTVMHCQDFPLTIKYHLFTRPIEIGRRIKRGFYY